MERNDRSAVICRISESDPPVVAFHASDDPYKVHWVPIDEQWREGELGCYECDFLPKGITSFSKEPLSILYSGIASSIVDGSKLPNTVEEVASVRFPFAIDDLAPSLYSTEFAYASCQRASLYSISQEGVSHSLEITPDVLIQPVSVCIQPSAHPLLYYASHEKGLFLCDFRLSKPELVAAVPHSSHLQRIEGDWNCYCFAHDGEINVIDIRNPAALEMRWRFDGALQKLDCHRCSASQSNQYNILCASPRSPSLPVVTAKVRRKREEQLLGRVMTQTLLDLSSTACSYAIPSLHDDALQLIYSSVKPFDYAVLPRMVENEDRSVADAGVCSFITFGWDHRDSYKLECNSLALNASIQHLSFSYGRVERIWESPQSAVELQQETLRSVDVDSLMKTDTEWVDDVSILQSIVDHGFFKQPQSVMEVCSVIEARTGKHVRPCVVLEWLRWQGLKEVRTIGREHRRNDFEGIVFVDEQKCEDMLSPFTAEQHPIDKKRIDVLSNIWDHLETDNAIII